MSEDTHDRTGAQQPGWLGAVTSVLGGAAATIAWGPKGAAWLQKKRGHGYGGLALAKHRHRARYATLAQTGEALRFQEVQDTIDELLEDQDWVTLSELADEWDAAKAYVAGDAPLAVHALHKATWSLSNGYYEASFCTPFPIPVIDSVTINLIAHARSVRPESHFLACLAANLHLMRAWEYRATEDPNRVDADGLTKSERCEVKSKAAVQHLLDAETPSAMLGMLRIGWLAHAAENTAEFRRAFREYRAVDPVSGYGDRWLGYYMLPRWFGDHDFASELRKECDVLGHHGPAAYVWGFLKAQQVEAGILIDIDADYFAQGVRNIAESFAGNQYRLNGFLADVLHLQTGPEARVFSLKKRTKWNVKVKTIKAACADVLRRHVTGLVPEFFPNDAPLLDLMSEAMPEAFARGDYFVLDEGGLRSVPDPQSPASNGAGAL